MAQWCAEMIVDMVFRMIAEVIAKMLILGANRASAGLNYLHGPTRQDNSIAKMFWK
jgi:hypothetical protein